ncbi:HAD family phosphatase [Pedobacter sp. BS3]|uniref:HAD family hydrolase n=1 Tax=Pedobacter sp. BS3 TaxID=2567937 RepID=UPI0011EF733E|nr:HAD family phosphatase [Pedobacter sp. BS3]TZF81781.1 HAD family phosphatase [Pedobacter sp. BS3]
MQAFLFDLNGTVIDDMAYHGEVWHDILTRDLGASITPEETKLQMYGKNRDLLIRIFGEGHFTEEEMKQISHEKEKRYQSVYGPHLKLINGLDEFLAAAHRHHIKMAIGSAAITFNINFVINGLNLHQYFPVVVSADNVTNSKPDPETFVKAANLLGVNPADCVVFEDNPKGVEAALRGGMKAVVITTMHQPHEFEGLTNILAFITDYTDPFLNSLLQQN